MQVTPSQQRIYEFPPQAYRQPFWEPSPPQISQPQHVPPWENRKHTHMGRPSVAWRQPFYGSQDSPQTSYVPLWEQNGQKRHENDKAGFRTNGKFKKFISRQNNNSGLRQCWACNQEDHIFKDCPRKHMWDNQAPKNNLSLERDRHIGISQQEVTGRETMGDERTLDMK